MASSDNGKAFVLLSGGIDSATCLYQAIEDFGDVEAISIDYGQRHAKELITAATLAKQRLVPHHVIDLSNVIPRGSMLTNEAQALPDASYSDLPEGISPTYVPFRNGLMLSAVASHVQGRWDEGAGLQSARAINMPLSEFDGARPMGHHEWAIYFGAHAEDAQNWAYPDCTPEFIGAMANAIYIGSYRAIRLHTPLQWLTKAQVISLGESHGVPFKDTWSCYAGGELHCGTCPTCRARKAGFEEAGVPDPTEYANVAS
jgi:7-cyano-7-deazaguanine synthase